MRRQHDSRLKLWAREVRQHLTHDDSPVACLVYHGDPAAGPATAHAEDAHSVHLLDLDEVEPDDVIRLGQPPLAEGVKEVTVTQDGVSA